MVVVPYLRDPIFASRARPHFLHSREVPRGGQCRCRARVRDIGPPSDLVSGDALYITEPEEGHGHAHQLSWRIAGHICRAGSHRTSSIALTVRLETTGASEREGKVQRSKGRGFIEKDEAKEDPSLAIDAVAILFVRAHRNVRCVPARVR
eukprot:257538-Prymnesium_polylepis.1